MVSDLNNQNVSLFLLALMAAALVAERRSSTRAGALLGLGAALKVWPVAALAALSMESRRRSALLGGGVAAGVTAAIAPALWLGPTTASEAYRFWFTQVLPAAGGGELANQS